jgi:hypothetical protein
MLPALAVQRAIYRTLAEDDELQSLVSGVFDDVPEGTEFPYVVIGEGTLLPDNYLTGFGREVRVTLHVWSRTGVSRKHWRSPTACASCWIINRWRSMDGSISRPAWSLWKRCMTRTLVCGMSPFNFP